MNKKKENKLFDKHIKTSCTHSVRLLCVGLRSLLLISIFCCLLVNIAFCEEEICAAWIQGGCTLIGTLVAGGCAVWAGSKAFQAATNDTRLSQEKEEKKCIAYRFMMKTTLENLENDIKRHEENYVCDKGQLRIFEVPAEIDQKNWENNSMLKDDEIRDIYKLFTLLKKNYLYALYHVNKKILEDFESGGYGEPVTQEIYTKTVFEDMARYRFSEEHKGYLAKCTDMKDEEFKDSFVEIIAILEALIKKLK